MKCNAGNKINLRCNLKLIIVMLHHHPYIFKSLFTFKGHWYINFFKTKSSKHSNLSNNPARRMVDWAQTKKLIYSTVYSNISFVHKKIGDISEQLCDDGGFEY
jgi:hypothetical protein